MSAFALSGRFHGKRVAVLRGGLSAEREVSLNTGRAIAAALRERPYTVVEVDPGTICPPCSPPRGSTSSSTRSTAPTARTAASRVCSTG
jgi:hypothetical protein